MIRRNRNEMCLSDLMVHVAAGILDAQLELDKYGLKTEELLTETEFPAQTIPVAIVESVDDKGRIVQVEALMNRNPISLSGMGLSPVFLEICESEAMLEMLFHLRDSSESAEDGDTWQSSAMGIAGKLQHAARFRELFAAPVVEAGPGEFWQRKDYQLTTSSSTQAAMRSKRGCGQISSRILFTIRPKANPNV